jgi:site-specific recombinase XerD
MAAITLSLSSKVEKVTGKSEILLRFVGGRNRVFRVKSGLYIKRERWNSNDEKAIIPRIETHEQKILVLLQTNIDKMRNAILEAFLVADKSTVDKSWLETQVDKFHFPEKYDKVWAPKSFSFIELFDKFLTEKKISAVRKKNYEVVKRSLLRFELYFQATENASFELTFDSLTPDILRQLDKFLRDEFELCIKPEYKVIYEVFPEKRTPQPRGQNTLNNDFTKIRTFFHWAIDNGHSMNDPFKKFKIKESIYGTPIYITTEERNQIYAADLSSRPQLAIQRDIFIFQCHIGCRIGDLYALTKSSVINGMIEYIPRKTKEDTPLTVSVPLHNTAKEILDRYKDISGEKLLPYISEQKYNAAIKTIFAEAKITRMVTILNPTTRLEEKKPINEIASSHIARKTFIGNLYKKVKDPNQVGALTGHKEGSRAFARYRNIDNDQKQYLISLLD